MNDLALPKSGLTFVWLALKRPTCERTLYATRTRNYFGNSVDVGLQSVQLNDFKVAIKEVALT